MSQQQAANARGETARNVPELPRVVVDTRMPPTPAPGGRIITVGGRGGRAKKAALDGGLVVGVLTIAATVTIVWRVVRHGGARQRLL